METVYVLQSNMLNKNNKADKTFDVGFTYYSLNLTADAAILRRSSSIAA